jgi:hypothetical protein
MTAPAAHFVLRPLELVDETKSHRPFVSDPPEADVEAPGKSPVAIHTPFGGLAWGRASYPGTPIFASAVEVL